MGRPKLLLPWGDTTVLGHHVRVWRDLGTDAIGVVIGHASEAVTHELGRLDSTAAPILNANPAGGMFSSIATAARWDGWLDELTHWAVVLGDQPHLPKPILAALIAFQKLHPESICQPGYHDTPCHPVSLPKWAFKKLAQSAGPTLKHFLDAHSGQRRTLHVDAPTLEHDIDTPQDYEQLRPKSTSAACL